jgi:hypothetical protein
MTLPRLKALTKYWADIPPVHAMLAAYAGYKPPEKAKPIEEEGDLGELIGLFKAIGGEVITHGK